MFVKNLKDTKTASDLENFHTVHLLLVGFRNLVVKCIDASMLVIVDTLFIQRHEIRKNVSTFLKLPLYWCHKPTYELERAIFLQPPPVIFIKQLCVVFQCLLGYVVWKLVQSGGSRSKSWFLYHLCSDSIIKCNFSSISLVKI